MNLRTRDEFVQRAVAHMHNDELNIQRACERVKNDDMRDMGTIRAALTAFFLPALIDAVKMSLDEQERRACASASTNGETPAALVHSDESRETERQASFSADTKMTPPVIRSPEQPKRDPAPATAIAPALPSVRVPDPVRDRRSPRPPNPSFWEVARKTGHGASLSKWRLQIEKRTGSVVRSYSGGGEVMWDQIGAAEVGARLRNVSNALNSVRRTERTLVDRAKDLEGFKDRLGTDDAMTAYLDNRLTDRMIKVWLEWGQPEPSLAGATAR